MTLLCSLCFSSEAMAQSVKQNATVAKNCAEQCCKDKAVKKTDGECCAKKVDGVTSSTAVKNVNKKSNADCCKSNDKTKECCKKDCAKAKKAAKKAKKAAKKAAKASKKTNND